MKKIIGSCLLFAAIVLGGSAQATVALSSVTVAGLPLIAANASCATCGTVVKSIQLCNDTLLDTCALIKDAGGTVRLPICAKASSCEAFPKLSGGISAWAGELFVSTTALRVFSSTASASVYVQAWYAQPSR